MRSLRLVLGVLLMVSFLGLTIGSAVAQDDGPTVTVEPSTGLSDGDTLAVSVTGFPADSTAFSSGQCVTPLDDFLQQCDVGNIVPVPLDADGAAEFMITIKTGDVGSGMCGEGLDQCVVAVGSLTESEAGGAPIFFGADEPASGDAESDDAAADDAESDDAEAADLAETGANTDMLIVAAITLVLAGLMLAAGSRRLRVARN